MKKKAFGFFALIMLVAILLLIFLIVRAVTSHERNEERQLIVLLDDYSVSFGMDQEELTALLGKPSSANVTSQGISQVIVYENLSLCGYSVRAEFHFSPYEYNRLTHIHASICVNTLEEAEQVCKSIADTAEERLNSVNPEIAKTVIQGGMMLIVGKTSYTIEAVQYAGPSWYVNIQVSRDG